MSEEYGNTRDRPDGSLPSVAGIEKLPGQSRRPAALGGSGRCQGVHLRADVLQEAGAGVAEWWDCLRGRPTGKAFRL